MGFFVDKGKEMNHGNQNIIKNGSSRQNEFHEGEQRMNISNNNNNNGRGGGGGFNFLFFPQLSEFTKRERIWAVGEWLDYFDDMLLRAG